MLIASPSINMCKRNTEETVVSYIWRNRRVSGRLNVALMIKVKILIIINIKYL